MNQGCDVDCDGFVDSDDAVYLLYNVLFGDEEYPLFDDSTKAEVGKDEEGFNEWIPIF